MAKMVPSTGQSILQNDITQRVSIPVCGSSQWMPVPRTTPEAAAHRETQGRPHHDARASVCAICTRDREMRVRWKHHAPIIDVARLERPVCLTVALGLSLAVRWQHDQLPATTVSIIRFLPKINCGNSLLLCFMINYI